ncbi:MAG: glycosyltransferase family 2 protein, partial [Gemmatimonadota bacterium]
MTDTFPLLSVIVPVYNEEATVERCIRRVLEVSLSMEVIAVDDGSTDGTPAILEGLMEEGLIRELITQRPNRGKGSAVRRGIAAARGEVVVIQDADLEYDPADLPALLEP